ncbi:hypothetical protein COOONC_05338 [Cooperia oncophora]
MEFGPICICYKALQIRIKVWLHFNLRTDGLDCGDDAAEFFSKAIDEPDVRLLMYVDGLFTERTCVTHPDWWNNNVPKRKDNCAYADLAPYMITTQAFSRRTQY